MSRGLTKKEIKKDEFLEAATDAGEWLESNWKMVMAWAGGLAVLAILIAGWYFMSKARDEAAQDILGQGMQVLATGDYEQAIDLFGQAADKGGSGATEAVAELYRGITLSRTGRNDEAVPILTKVGETSSVLLVAQTARAVLAGIHETAGEYEQAEAIYMTLSTEEGGVYPPARALLNAGRARLAMGREAEAQELFEGIVRDYPQSAAAAEVNQLLQP
jgi:tetratricopeptide (TPR) repeat protein